MNLLQDRDAELGLCGYLMSHQQELQEIRRSLPAHALTTPWLRQCYEALCTGTHPSLNSFQRQALEDSAAAGPECARSFARHLAALRVERLTCVEAEERLLRAQRRVIALVLGGHPLAGASTEYARALKACK